MRPNSGNSASMVSALTRPHAGDLLQTLRPGHELGGRRDLRVELRELFFQLLLSRVREFPERGQPRVFAPVDLVGHEGHDFLPGAHQFAELVLARGERWVGGRAPTTRISGR
jgi:hypothetical protein